MSSVSEALNLTGYDCKPLDEMTQEEILKTICVYDYITVNAILKHAQKDDVDAIIQETADKTVKLAANLPNKHQIRWHENCQKVKQAVTEKFPALFEQVEREVAQRKVQLDFQTSLENLNSRITSYVSALISTEDEAQACKQELDNEFDKLLCKVITSALWDEFKYAFLCKIEGAREKAHALVDTRLKEKPACLLYYKTGGKVSCKVNINTNKFSYKSGHRKDIHYNQGPDRDQYPLIVSCKYIWDFLDANKIRHEDVLVDPNSVDKFYRFDNQISVGLTKSFVNAWWNYDCPYLFRCKPNKDRSVSAFGLALTHFENELVESSFSADYIDDSITEEEVEKLTNGREHTRIYKEMQAVIKAGKLREDPESVEVLKNEVHDFDEKVQKVIDAHSDEILSHIKQVFRHLVYDKGDGTWAINDAAFGLDCGLINIWTADQAYMEKRRMLKNLDPHEYSFMKLELPYNTPIVTIKKEQFNKIKEIVKKELDVELLSSTILD